jgi:hypothetical protein
MDDNQALWVLGDSVLARRDRRVHERWKAGLGITFVLACHTTSVRRLSSLIVSLFRQTFSLFSSSASHSSSTAEPKLPSPAYSRRSEPDTSLVWARTAPFPPSSASSLRSTRPLSNPTGHFSPASAPRLSARSARTSPYAGSRATRAACHHGAQHRAIGWSRAWSGTSVSNAGRYPGRSRSASQECYTWHCAVSTLGSSCALILISARSSVQLLVSCSLSSLLPFCGTLNRR